MSTSQSDLSDQTTLTTPPVQPSQTTQPSQTNQSLQKNLRLQEFALSTGKIDNVYQKLLAAVVEVETHATFANMSLAMELSSTLSLFVLTYPHDYPDKVAHQEITTRTRRALGYN